MKLKKIEFIPDPVIDQQRQHLANIGDQIFLDIQGSIKKSENHLKLLKKFEDHNSIVEAFLKEHKWYFNQKRAYLMLHSSLNRVLVKPMDSEEKLTFSEERKTRW